MRASLPTSVQVAAFALAFAYFAFALVHLYWTMGGRRGLQAAIPHRGGKPAFRPGRSGTFIVAVALAACSLLLLAWLRCFPVPVSRATLRISIGLLSVAMLVRALGDFRYVGFFRSVRDSAFARLDRLFYTPASLVIGVALLLIALTESSAAHS